MSNTETMNATETAKLAELLNEILNLAKEIKGRHAASVIGSKAIDALAILAASNVADFHVGSGPHKPRKHSRVRVISQDAAQVVGAKIFVSHIGLLNRLIGQRLGRIGSARRASSFYQLGTAA